MTIANWSARSGLRPAVWVAGAIAVALTIGACTNSSPTADNARTSPSGAQSSTLTAPGSTPATSAPTSVTTSVTTTATTPTIPKPTSSTSLGGDCSTVLPVVAVDRAVGKAVPGKTAFIVNVPDDRIGQVERVNCQFGLLTPKGQTKAAAPLVEASVSLYDTAAHAAARVAATQETWREHQAVPHPVTVTGHRGVVLIGYGAPLLVLGAGARTVAVSAATSLVPAARTDAVLVALAASALRGAGG